MDKNKIQKYEQERNDKRILLNKLFVNIKDDEFLSANEEMEESIQFPKEIKKIEENNKNSNNNLLSINKNKKPKIISSSSLLNISKEINIQKEIEKDYNQNELSIIQNNIIFYDEKNIDDDNKENDIEKIINYSNNDKININQTIQINDKKDIKMSKLNKIKLTSKKKNKFNTSNLSNKKTDNNNDYNKKNRVEDKNNNYNNNNRSCCNKQSYNNGMDISCGNSSNNSIVNHYFNNNSNINNKNIMYISKSKKSNLSIFSNKNENNNFNSERSDNTLIQKIKKKDSKLDIDENNNKNIINLKPITIKIKNHYRNQINLETLSNVNTNEKILESDEIFHKNINVQKSIRANLILPTKKLSYNSRYSSNNSNNNDNNKINFEDNNIIRCKTLIEKKLLNIPILIFISILHLFSLISSDIKHIWLPREVDLYFDIVNYIILLYLIFEIIIVSILHESYLFGLIFWVDVIGAICVIFDIEMFVAFVLGYGPIDKNFENSKITNSIEYIVVCTMMFGRAIRASKIFRILKFYNVINTKKKFKNLYTDIQNRDIVTEEENKQKLIQKIQILEASEDESDESYSSENSFHNSDEEKESNINKNYNNNIKRSNSHAINGINFQMEKEITKDLKNINSKRKSRISQRKNSLRILRQNNSLKNSARYSVADVPYNFNNFNYEGKDEKKIEKENEKKLKEKREEELYKKIDEAIKNTKITSRVNNSVRKKLIIILIIILIICIILDEEIFSNYKDNITSYVFIFEPILYYSSHNDTNNEKIKKFLSSIEGNDFPVINITENDKLIYENEKLVKKNLRYCELLIISSNKTYSEKNEIINIVYSKKSDSDLKHILLFLGTLLVFLSLIISSIYFEKDLTNILLSPIEVMIIIANRVANDPMNAKDIEDLEQDIIGLLPKSNSTIKKINKKNKNNDIKEEKEINIKYYESYNCYEVQTILTAIVKISALLAMSVGEAGGEIIHKNLSSHHELHLHSRGKKKIAIFGFCNIRNFEQINLVLEEETIPLINKIAEIVHSSVDKFRGSTNKNIGNTFLNVWKFYNNLNMKSSKNIIKLKKDNLIEIDPTNPQIGITADCSVLAYLRCILKINKNLNILSYKKNKLLKEINPNFKIDMGFGLHLGYGIEGPVGSLFKMEVSYLSPNVNIASRLQTATNQFGVSLLISGKLYNLFSEEMKQICRYVDCVTVKGSSEPIDLYTIDINYNVRPQKIENIKIINDQKEKAKIFKEKKMMLESLIEQYRSVSSLILDKESYLELIDEKSEKFYDSWEYAMYFYKKGDWKDAKLYFEQCLKEDSNDGPANTLYNYIKKYDFESPINWRGERELTSK